MMFLTLQLQSINIRFLRPLIRWHRTYQPRLHSSRRDIQFKSRVYSHLQLKYANSEYNVYQLSSDMGMSRSQLFRNCKRVFGLSPVKLIQDYRLEKSREFLKSGFYNVSEAAYLSGFSSLSYFSKSFKKKYRQVPSKWIE